MPTNTRIRVLPEETANRVAAGEVVERPAAALKELLENSIDAGASLIEVELSRSGRGMIRVSDDGGGMGPDDLVLSIERHATSKIAVVEDLTRVTTYGFRGEALPSIAAVSRLRIETREKSALAGTRLESEFGRILRVSPCGCPMGTRVEVRDLFQALPARLKFLRSEATELGHCLQIAARLALACPAVGIGVRHNQRELLRLQPAADTGARLREHLGRDFFAGLVPVRGGAESCTVSGFVSRPGAGRPGADYQQLFVNGRPVRDPFLAQGVREACRDHFLQERHGVSYFLWLKLPASLVDVNVHPTKREVRFSDPSAVLGVVGTALRGALRADRTAAYSGSPAVAHPSALSSGPPDPAAPGIAASPAQHPSGPAFAAEPSVAARYVVTAEPEQQLPLVTEPAASSAALPGPVQLFGTYLICPGPEGLVLVDQHAAHERILYERFLSRPGDSGCQQLLEPILFEITPAEEQVLESLRPALSALSVAVELIGPRSWRVLSVPFELEASAAVALVRELLARTIEEGAPSPVEDFRHRAAALMACHAAVRANQRLGGAQIAALLADLARTGNPGACPHGRPTSFAIGRDEIERRFKRA